MCPDGDDCVRRPQNHSGSDRAGPLLPPFRNLECDSRANQLFERRFVNRVVFANVDGPSCIALLGSN